MPSPETLDALLNRLVTTGRFQHLSVIQVAPGDFQVCFRTRQGAPYYLAMGDDPVAAIREATAPESWEDVL